MIKAAWRLHRNAVTALILAALTFPLFAFALYVGDYVSAASNVFVMLGFLFMARTNSDMRDVTVRQNALRQMAEAMAESAPAGSWLVAAGACPKCQATGQATPSDIVVLMECGVCHHQWPARPLSAGEPHRVH